MAQLPKPINVIQLLQELQGGGLLVDTSDQLQKVISGVHASGKKGKLVITLDFAKVSEFTHSINASVKATIPRPTVSGDAKFHDGVGNIFNADPRQYNMHDEFTPRRMSAVASRGAPAGVDPETGEMTGE